MGLMLGKAACGAHAGEGCMQGSCWGSLRAGLILGKAAGGLMLGKAACGAHAGEGCVWGSCWGRLCAGLMSLCLGLIFTHPLEDIEGRKLTFNIGDEFDGPQCSGVVSIPWNAAI